jgi:mRNA interferase RelE/StbE
MTSPADRDLRHVPSDDLKRLNVAFDDMADDPYGGDTRMLRGTGGAFRRRVGDWRIVFELHAEKHLVVVLGVKRRSSTTY